jgi:hypothetical protein
MVYRRHGSIWLSLHFDRLSDSAMGARVGDLKPCNPYAHLQASEPVAPVSIDKNLARLKLLDLIKQPKSSSSSEENHNDRSSEFLTDTEISSRAKTKAEPAKARFSNESGLNFLAKLNGSTPTKPPAAPAHGITSASTPPTTSATSTEIRSTALSVSPINVYANPRELFTPPDGRSNLPPPMQQPYQQQLPPQQLHYSYPAQQLFQPPVPPGGYLPPHMQPMPVPGYPHQQYPPGAIPSWPMQPLRGSPYDPAPMNHYPHAPVALPPQHLPNRAIHPTATTHDGATSYLMSRFGKPPS